MTADGEPILDFADRAAQEGFQTISLRTEPMTPALAARVMRRLSEQDGFNPQKIASHIEELSPAPESRVQVGKSNSQVFVAASIPWNPKRAFEWAYGLMIDSSATSVKMNIGPGKATHVKIFWGKPEVNTLVEIGGTEL